MNKYFKEVITYKALDIKVGTDEIFQPLFERALQSDNQEDIKLRAQVKNVCAPIPLAMNEQLEQITKTLRISKSRFLTLAIASAMEEAKVLIDEIDIDEYQADYLNDLAEQQAKSKEVA